MSDKNRLPVTSRELAAFRKKAPSKLMVNRVDDLLMKHWGKDPKLHAVLQTRALNGSTVEGTMIADKLAGAMYIREKALAAGDAEMAEVQLAKLSNMIGTVLRRFDLEQLKLENAATEADEPTEQFPTE